MSNGRSALIATADPGFADLARAELPPGSRVQAGLAPGVWLVSLAGTFEETAARWQERPPIFIRHVCPAQAVVRLGDAALLPAALESVVAGQFLPRFDPALPFSVQTRILGDLPLKPFDVNNALAALIQERTAAPLDPRAPQQALSVVLAAATQTAYLGLSLVAQNLSDWAGGARRFAREPGQVSRSEFKLLEALELFRIALPPGGVALDLGAAPGGWTRVLRQRGQWVTAVDPAPLHPGLAADSGVRYRPLTAEAYLASGPDRFDLIANDMRQDARDSARLMAAYAPFLYRHGAAVMTLKLPESGREKVLERALAILSRAYHLAGARHLFHNRSEVTVNLRPK